GTGLAWPALVQPYRDNVAKWFGTPECLYGSFDSKAELLVLIANMDASLSERSRNLIADALVEWQKECHGAVRAARRDAKRRITECLPGSDASTSSLQEHYNKLASQNPLALLPTLKKRKEADLPVCKIIEGVVDSDEAALSVIETVGRVPDSEQLSQDPTWQAQLKSYTADLVAAAPPEQPASMFTVAILVSLELLVCLAAAPQYLRALAFICLLSVWSSLRADDIQGLLPQTMHLDERGLSIDLARSKTTGPDKRVKSIKIFVDRQISLTGQDWLQVLSELGTPKFEAGEWKLNMQRNFLSSVGAAIEIDPRELDYLGAAGPTTLIFQLLRGDFEDVDSICKDCKARMKAQAGSGPDRSSQGKDLRVLSEAAMAAAPTEVQKREATQQKSKTELPATTEAYRKVMRVEAFSWLCMSARFKSKQWLQGLKLSDFDSFVSYILGEKVAQLSVPTTNLPDVPALTPPWDVVLAYEHRLRKEAFRLVNEEDQTLSAALATVVASAELKETYFTTPLALSILERPRKWYKGGGKDGKGKGRDICFAFNNQGCDGKCGRLHVCRVKGCDQDHAAKDHKQQEGLWQHIFHLLSQEEWILLASPPCVEQANYFVDQTVTACQLAWQYFLEHPEVSTRAITFAIFQCSFQASGIIQPGTGQLLIKLRGGEVWIESESGDSVQVIGGKQMRGTLVPITAEPVFIEAHSHIHFTMPWRGTTRSCRTMCLDPLLEDEDSAMPMEESDPFTPFDPDACFNEGQPLKLEWDGTHENIDDGFGLCSPTRAMRQILKDFVVRTVPDTTRKLRAEWISCIETFSEETCHQALDVPESQPFFLYTLSATAQLLEDPDWQAIACQRDSYVTGVSIGFDEPAEHIPQVFEYKTKFRKLDESAEEWHRDNYASAKQTAGQLEEKFKAEEALGRMEPSTLPVLKERWFILCAARANAAKPHSASQVTSRRHTASSRFLLNIWFYHLVFVDDVHSNFSGKDKFLHLLMWLVSFEMFGTPFAYKKFRGGLSSAFVGYESSYTDQRVGISESRGQWLLKWISEARATKFMVSVRRFGEFLGRLGFVSRLLVWIKPHLAPLYAWKAAVSDSTVARLPDTAILALEYLNITFRDMTFKVSASRITPSEAPYLFDDEGPNLRTLGLALSANRPLERAGDGWQLEPWLLQQLAPQPESQGLSAVIDRLAKYSKYDSNPRAWIDLQNEERSLGMVKWLKIILVEPLAFGVARNYYASKAAGLSSGTLLKSVSDALSVKATATVHARANKMLRYISWAKGRTLHVLPLSEGIVYAYLEDTQGKAAATAFRSFLSSVAFAKYSLGLIEADAVLDSGRVRGLSAQLFMLKRRLQQRNPLRVKDLVLLEEICAGRHNRPLQERVAAGFFTFLVHARARFSDGQRVCKIVYTKGLSNYLEVSVSKSKTSYSLERKVRYLPMAARAVGVSGIRWADAWVDAMRDSAIVISEEQPLLPCPASQGQWRHVPLPCDQACNWLRALLAQNGDDAFLSNVGTHSCKRTLLAWTSKRGLPRDTRAIRGYHTSKSSGVGAELIYEADAQAHPLSRLSDMLDEVSEGYFNPDAPRGQQLRAAAGIARDQVEPHSDDDMASSSESSGDEEEPEYPEDEAATAKELGDWPGRVAVSKLPENAEFFRNVQSRVIHLAADEVQAMLQEICSLKDSGGSHLPHQKRERCRQVGMETGDIEALKRAGVTTLAKVAFLSAYTPGSGDDKALTDAFEAALGTSADLGQKAAFRRLFHESFAVTTSEMKSLVERTEETAPRRLSVPERTERFNAIVKKLPGLEIRNRTEPSDALVDACVAMYESNKLSFLEWEKLTSKEHEANSSSKRETVLAIDASGKLKTEKPDPARADTSTELLVQLALTRRGIAFEMSNILSYNLHTRWVERLMSARLDPVPASHSLPSMAQLQAADRKLFQVLADQSRWLTCCSRSPWLPGLMAERRRSGQGRTPFNGGKGRGGKGEKAKDGLLWVEGEGTEHKTLGKAEVQGGFPLDNRALKNLCPPDTPFFLWTGVATKIAASHTLCNLTFERTAPGPSFAESLSVAELCQARVDSANLIYDNTADFRKWLLQTSPNTGFTVENPLHSWMWQLPSFQDLQQLCSFVSFDACRHGSSRNKATALLTNVECVGTLSGPCPGCKSHAAWGRTHDGFATSSEAAYPKLLCERLVACIDIFAAAQECLPLASPTTSLAEARAAAQKQPRGTEDADAHVSRFFVFGVYRSPESFLREASMLKHPFDVARALPDGMVRALFKVLVEGPVSVIKTRLNLLKLWRGWALELEPAESKVRDSMAPSVRRVLSGKRTLLLQKIAASPGWPDKNLHRDITQGFKLTGYLECTNIFRPDEKPAYSTEQDFWDGASVLRDSLWEKVASHKVQDYSQELWDITTDEADPQSKGWLQGPLSKAQLDAMFPEGWSPCRRFAVWQGKWRPIDDFSECGINACFGCFERISLKALDEITWACVQIFKCAVARGDVSFALQDGSVLKGKLHSAWRDKDRVRPLSKTYDLKSAYKQMPLHPDERRKAIIILKNPSTLQVEAFVCNTLPFGSTASVLHFNRVALLLQRVMWELCLISACYYDDFPTAMPAMLGEGSDNIVHTVMQLLGYDMSVEKETPYSTSSEMLGVVLDTSDPALECVHLRNKTEKAEAMSQSLGKIMEAGVVSTRDLPSMLGRLQFLESQLFGRAGKLALADLRQVEKSSHETVTLDSTHLDALKLLRARLLASKPR
ncbi:PARP6, partial [Symbiodinium sp. CCMP2456]